jgi:uncharacterized Zn finger protein
LARVFYHWQHIFFNKPGGNTLKCPNCCSRADIYINMHSSGFSAEHSLIKECGACGLVWRIKIEAGESVVDIIKAADAP